VGRRRGKLRGGTERFGGGRELQEALEGDEGVGSIISGEGDGVVWFKW
jgi:hypothetical protein